MFLWTFSNLKVYPNHSGLTNVMASVNYRYAYTDETTTSPLTTYTYGSLTFAAPDPLNFIAFEDVTESDFETMVEDTIGSSDLAAMQSDLQADYATPRMDMDMPWMPVEQDLIEDTGIEEPVI